MFGEWPALFLTIGDADARGREVLRNVPHYFSTAHGRPRGKTDGVSVVSGGNGLSGQRSGRIRFAIGGGGIVLASLWPRRDRKCGDAAAVCACWLLAA
jgi:hypothetical protein